MIKVYRIGGRNYEMPPLRVGQKVLIQAWEIDIAKRLVSATVSEREAIDGAGTFGRLAFTVGMDSAALWSAPETIRSLATILIPEGFQFDKTKIDEIAAHFETVETSEFDSVFADFFFIAMKSGGNWMRLLSELKSEKKSPDVDSASANPQ